MKLLQRISIIVLITFSNISNINAQTDWQCSFDESNLNSYDVPDNYTLSWQHVTGFNDVFKFPVTEGITYEWSLSIDDGANNVANPNGTDDRPYCLAYADVDAANTITGDTYIIGSDEKKKLIWTANYTGSIYIQTYNRFSNLSPADLVYRSYDCNPISNLTLSTLNETNTFCVGQSQVLSYPTVPNAYYRWFVNGLESVLHESTFSVYESGQIQMEITLPNTSCAVYTNDINIAEENVFITMSDSITSLCNVVSFPPTPPVSKTLFANSNGQNGSYQWFKDGQPIATTNSIVIIESGLYKVKRTGGSPFSCIAVDSIQILIGTVPTTPNINLLSNDTICNGGQAQLEITNSVGSNLIYIWQLNGADIPASSFSNWNTSIEGTYSLVLSDSVGCLSASSNTLTITTIDCVGFETLLEADIKFYPNPANQFLNLTMPSDYQVASIAIFDMQGRILNLIVAPSYNGIYQIPLHDISNGLYFISINTSKGFITKRFEKFN